MWHQTIVLNLHVWIPHWKIADAYIFSELSHLVNLRPFEKKGWNFVNSVSQKVFKLESINLCQLIGYIELNIW